MAKRKAFDDFDPAPAGPSVSETLRGTRMAYGYDLRAVATTLRIRYPYLLAIEEGRYQELPGTTYAIGFLRSYAELLGLDPDAIAARYKEEASGTVRRPQLYLPTPAAEGKASGGTLLLGTLVLAGIVYGGWYYLSATDRSMADLVPALPDRLVSLLDGLPLKTGAQPAGEGAAPNPADGQAGATATATTEAPAIISPAAPSTTTTAAPAPASGPASTASAPAPAVTGAPAASVAPAGKPATPAPPVPAAGKPPAAVVNVAPPPSEEDEDGSPQEPTPLTAAAPPPAVPAAPAAETVPATGKVYGTLNTNAKLVLKATQESWLQVREGSEVVFTRALKPGDTFRVPDKSNVRIRTGNAGGLVVMAEGGESGPLGSVGQVLRDVSIDARGVVRR